MTPHDIEIIRTGFKALARDPDGFETEFQATLLKRAANLRPKFKVDLQREGRTMAGLLSAALKPGARPEAILSIMEKTARRHTASGIRPSDYAALGEALLETLGTRLGAAFTEEVSEVWRDTYVAFSEIMLAASYNPIHMAA